MKRFIFLTIVLITMLSLPAKSYLSEDSDYLDVYYEKLDDGGFAFYGDNKHFIPMYINLKFTKLTNLKMSVPNPIKQVLEPGTKNVLLCELTPIKAGESYRFGSSFSYSNGDPLNTKPDDYIYMFPFAHGEKNKLDQGFGGKFSHTKENYYALDFSMDIGTPIYAARAGVVVEIKENSNRGGAGSSYAKDGNFVSIYHSDGTFASYVHLKKNGAIVKVGDRVKIGDKIAYSGNTGLSTGPHLHFSVNVVGESGVKQSIPIKMQNIDGKALDPVTGEFYYAVHPKGPEFVAIFGKDIKSSDYEGFSNKVKKDNKVKIYHEKVDHTTIVYCKNGYDKKISGTIKFSLRNAQTSRKSPMKIEIPPLTEIYICLVTPKDRSKPYSFSSSMSYSYLE
ncbi:MAG: M23 family metallopeptidase [Spirochaetaceae bacterium]